MYDVTVAPLSIHKPQTKASGVYFFNSRAGRSPFGPRGFRFRAVLRPPVFVVALTRSSVFGGRFAPLVYDTTTGAEADVRARVRGRIVSAHRQRRQVRGASAAAAAETTNRLFT